jgi:hypothetical protein
MPHDFEQVLKLPHAPARQSTGCGEQDVRPAMFSVQ